VESGAPSAVALHCILVMQWEGQDYFGSLFFDDSSFREQIVQLLRLHTGLSITEIGSLDIPDQRRD
jgi:hypothetical protein